jgi:hypothetical protein
MQDVVAALHGLVRKADVGEVPFEELDSLYVIEVAALAGDQGIGDAGNEPCPLP